MKVYTNILRILYGNDSSNYHSLNTAGCFTWLQNIVSFYLRSSPFGETRVLLRCVECVESDRCTAKTLRFIWPLQKWRVTVINSGSQWGWWREGQCALFNLPHWLVGCFSRRRCDHIGQLIGRSLAAAGSIAADPIVLETYSRLNPTAPHSWTCPTCDRSLTLWMLSMCA